MILLDTTLLARCPDVLLPTLVCSDVLVAVNPYDALSKAGRSVYDPGVAWHFFMTVRRGPMGRSIPPRLIWKAGEG